MTPGLDCPAARGIVPHQGSNGAPCPARRILDPWTTREARLFFFRSILFNFQVFRDFPVFFILLRSNLIDSIMTQNKVCIFFSAFISFEICLMTQNLVGLISHTGARWVGRRHTPTVMRSSCPSLTCFI